MTPATAAVCCRIGGTTAYLTDCRNGSGLTRPSRTTGVAKTYSMTGWRVGWMIGPKDVISAAANLQSHATP